VLRSEATSQRSIVCAVLSNCRLLGRKREMKKSVITCALVLLVCLGLASSAQATIVDGNEEWAGMLDPGESFTGIVHFIPDAPNVPDSLIFGQAPEWTSTYWFDWETEGWDTVLADEGKTAYLYGPRLTNDTSSAVNVFSFRLFYQWDTDAIGFDSNYPVYQDVAIFDDLTLTYDCGWRGIPGDSDSWEKLSDDVTWREQDDPGSDPYENPVPEPVTICLLGLGSAFLRRKRSTLMGT